MPFYGKARTKHVYQLHMTGKQQQCVKEGNRVGENDPSFACTAIWGYITRFLNFTGQKEA